MTQLRTARPGERARFELPPPEARLWDPEKQGKFQTPVTDVGLVDLDQLVLLGEVTVDEAFDWRSRIDVHHLQWPRARYVEDELSMKFRELPRRKTNLPRTFHNWIHKLTLPPELPTAEVMRHVIEAEATARALADTASLAMRLTRKKEIKEGVLETRLEEILESYMQHAETARSIPPEFQVLRSVELDVRTVDDLLLRNRKLGQRALSTIPVRDRFVRSAA